MKYKKITDKGKEIYRRGGVLIDSASGQPVTMNELFSVKENDMVVNDKPFIKHLHKALYKMKIDTTKVNSLGYIALWSDYGLGPNNELSNEWLSTLKDSMNSKSVVLLLQRLIKDKLIARYKRGVYVLNPNIAQYGKVLPKYIYDLFK